MPATTVGVREFREQITRFLESETPVAVTRRGETLGVYVPTLRKAWQVEASELRDAADRLAAALSERDEDEKGGPDSFERPQYFSALIETSLRSASASQRSLIELTLHLFEDALQASVQPRHHRPSEHRIASQSKHVARG